jgi:hypothetical protein
MELELDVLSVQGKLEIYVVHSSGRKKWKKIKKFFTQAAKTTIN